MTDKAVFTFGRMNPVTTGHSKMASKVAELAKQHGADPIIFLSLSQDPEKNPLGPDDKARIVQAAFKGIQVVPMQTVPKALEWLKTNGYDDAIMVVGDDRVEAFNRFVPKDATGRVGMDSLEIVSAGTRDPDSDGVEGISATKVRQAAADGDFSSFAAMVPDTLSDNQKQTMFKQVRDGMGVKDEEPQVEPQMEGFTLSEIVRTVLL